MAKRTSAPNNILANIWDAASDTYTHVDIKGWMDKVDQVLGSLLADRVPLGTVIAWSFPDKTSPDTSALGIPAGWALCNGQTLTSSNHDFPAPFAGGSVVLPDYRNRVLVGADTGGSIRTAGDPATAPKVKGRQGANTAIVPDHSHDHIHSHRVGAVAGVETYHAVPADGAGGGLNDSPANNPPYINTDAAGTGHNVTLQGHAHQLAALYTSFPRDPGAGQIRVVDAPGTDPSALVRSMTTLQKRVTQPRASVGGAGNTGSITTTPAGGTAGDDLPVNTYQQSEGVYYLMKVKLAGDFSRPWTIRDTASSTASIGS